ncbi:MAG: polysaccharide lyase [Sedimentisphaerales bacterium]|nr:polysaccharide lyase [Sedimentisphaerales bacterium]
MRTLLASVFYLTILSYIYAEPIRLHPDNPHYLQWRGKPVVPITSGEHYGAVLNSRFDYSIYLKTLQADGMMLTRTFSGAYCEPVGAFTITNNTLAPAKDALLCPWARSDQSGYVNGGNKFDLTQWDPAYFKRLKDFIATAEKHDVVVELVLFCPFYKDDMWVLSPMYIKNNINSIGTMHREEVYTLKHPDLLKVQEAMVRKIVTELKDCDNLYYEICNEPYFGGVTLEWQGHIARTIVETEKKLGVTHLIAQNIANKTQTITNPNPDVSIFNFHYAKPPVAVTDNYGLDRVIGDDETGFAGSKDKAYRIEGWNFILAGGGIYNNLDYSFQAGHEDGKGIVKAPGGGGVEFRRQMRILRDFIHSFDFIHMQPDRSIVRGGLPDKAEAYALIQPGKACAVYLSGCNGPVHFQIDLPKDSWRIQWINTKTGKIENSDRFHHEGGVKILRSPKFEDDIALRIIKTTRDSDVALLHLSDFETGILEDWQISGNPPAITDHPVRNGRFAMKTPLNRQVDKVPYRTEVSGQKTEVGKEYWYGFSIYLPGDYLPDKIWEIVAQWHGVPDFDIGENWRNPVMALSTTNGQWNLLYRWDAKKNTFESGQRKYDGSQSFDLGPYQTERWTDWVVHVKWSFKDDGLLEIWKDGKKLIHEIGPNTFNDKSGPYFKMGLYKGWKDPDRPSDRVSKRLLYHDEFRMAGADGSYGIVVPRD